MLPDIIKIYPNVMIRNNAEYDIFYQQPKNVGEWGLYTDERKQLFKTGSRCMW